MLKIPANSNCRSKFSSLSQSVKHLFSAMRFGFSCAFLMMPCFVSAADFTPSSSPYGTCSHLAGGQEHMEMPKNLKLMRQAGIEWARADFSWSGIERSRGTWHFEHLDKVVNTAQEQGVTILPILDYSVPWAAPSYRNPEAWLEYVRRTVTHFKDQIRYWEVWNEQNLAGFWGDTPNPEAYAEFLKKTYLTIKEIDPELVVVYGGLAGVPADFYEKSLQAGAGEFFDVANIHPYRGGMMSENSINRFLEDIQKFHDLTIQYCGKAKPLWITEMGWATPPTLGLNYRALISGSLEKIYPDGIPGKIAVISDTYYPPSYGLSETAWKNLLPEGADFTPLLIADLSSLTKEKYSVLIMPPGEDFPVAYADQLRNFVRDGGTLVLLGGVPFYYQMAQTENGVWERPKKNPYAGNLAHSFRVHWIAWWTEKGVPETCPIQLADGAEALKDYPVAKVKGGRFFTDRLLKEGDSMEALIIPKDTQWTDGAKKGEIFDAPSACVYRFNSDWKGSIVASAQMDGSLGNMNRCVPENQGIFLSQAILLALSNGVERFFSYEFQAVEKDDVDPEHHFGITHADLTPKTGYLGYRTLTQARPSGSQTIPGNWNVDDGKLCVLSWKRPDGQIGYAIWAPFAERSKKMIFHGKVTDCFDWEGKKVSLSSEMTFSPAITYVIGENLRIEWK